MGIPVMIIGPPASGKSTALRKFGPSEIGIFNAEKKPLPFQKNLPIINTSNYSTIEQVLSQGQFKTYAIDDCQALIVNDWLSRSSERGFDKFVFIAKNFKDLIDFIKEKTPPDVIVYLLHHSELGTDGKQKAQTIGKMLDEKIQIVGLFTIVFYSDVDKDGHFFITAPDEVYPARSPVVWDENGETCKPLFEARIPNDLKMVDDTIREYYGIPREEAK